MDPLQQDQPSIASQLQLQAMYNALMGNVSHRQGLTVRACRGQRMRPRRRCTLRWCRNRAIRIST
jgi:hypothetical protein